MWQYVILDQDDPSRILQRGSELLFPETPWERDRRTGEPASEAWEWVGCCIGDASGLQPLPDAPEPDTFLLWYGGGDAVTGAAIVTVKREA